MKKYVFELTVTEGNDEFWESLKGCSGCDEILTELKSILIETGWDYNSEIKLKSYTDN